jgi:hypothetical protein
MESSILIIGWSIKKSDGHEHDARAQGEDSDGT